MVGHKRLSRLISGNLPAVFIITIWYMSFNSLSFVKLTATTEDLARILRKPAVMHDPATFLKNLAQALSIDSRARSCVAGISSDRQLYLLSDKNWIRRQN